MKQQSGFTLIELVVVIAILAILAAFALPRFAALADDAHRASVDATGGALASAVSLVRSQWLANGVRLAITNLPGYGEPNNVIDVSQDGWPTGVNGNTNPTGMTARECNDLWLNLMTNYSITADIIVGSDYLTTVNNGDCRYTYELTADGYNIEYDPQTGDIHTQLFR